MKRGLIIVHLVLLGCTYHLFAQEKSNEATIANQIDLFLLGHQIEPDSLILIGNWFNSDGFSSSYIEVKIDGRFKSGGSTCLGRYSYKGRWYLKDGQLSLNKGRKESKQHLYSFKEGYLLVAHDEETIKVFKEMALYLFRDKPARSVQLNFIFWAD